jgi:hypothetical protein
MLWMIQILCLSIKKMRASQTRSSLLPRELALKISTEEIPPTKIINHSNKKPTFYSFLLPLLEKIIQKNGSFIHTPTYSISSLIFFETLGCCQRPNYFNL